MYSMSILQSDNSKTFSFVTTANEENEYDFDAVEDNEKQRNIMFVMLNMS